MSTLTRDSAPQTPAAPPASGRDRYFDLLRALAIFRVVLYHLAGWSWLPLVFPSMGVMFALAGNLMARSLKRPALGVVRGRLRRLLPPVWLLGVVGVTGMVAQGWAPDPYWHPLWWWFHLAFWILPVSEPPYADGLPGVHGFIGADWAVELAGPLWYVRTYIWYVVLSPVLLRALRMMPVVTVLAPLALAALLELGWLAVPGERLASGFTDFTTFGACWLLGMAHQEGILRRLPRYVVPSVAPALALAGLWFAFGGDYGQGHDLDDMPFAQSLWSVAAVALLLHLSPSWSQWPPRLRRWDGVITFLNSRAVTIYLWHTTCIMIASTQWDRLWDVVFLEQHAPWLLESVWPVLALTWLLVVGCVVAFGWAEDLAARRRPRLWPRSGDAGRAASRS
ncbi:acyltransferase [Streptomyces scabiei]|uniref:acyltransferase family protein n=1 Tax=Streptomyces scabiei TaxID=1930 RepID=UPI001B30DC1D|nr:MULTISPECIES: acyltransferase [Streptomyces]MBP5876130.1 acyltransferase [Streptomyces sp. LBUM 1477]MBP5883865.1 acyltransferase [Streptomyces sp. LBUM 1487]MDW8473384.1 acyltransferase [Streptomyces scabiei]MDX2537308.1 acyltransferase [Streptomyces scabiei]MDX2567361.1 acyltransferase [Streptomyces scabiei]